MMDLLPDVPLRKIPGFQYFSVTNDGRVWQHERIVIIGNGGRRKQGGYWQGVDLSTGRPRYTICEAGKGGRLSAHVLVALAWIGPKPFPEAQVLHWDDNPLNNHVSNLRWGTVLDNTEDRERNGYSSAGERNPNAGFTNEQVKEIYLRMKAGESTTEVAKRFNVGRHITYYIKTKRAYSSVTNLLDKQDL